MYPGYAQAFRTDVLNVGTLATKLSNIKFDIYAESAMKADDMLGIALYTHQEQYSPDKSKDGQNVFKLAKSLGLNLVASAVVSLIFAVIYYELEVIKSARVTAPAGGADFDDDEEDI